MRLATALDRARLTNFYQDSKKQRPQSARRRCRSSAAWPSRRSTRSATACKALLTGGMLFEELGFRYVGPIDGHDLPTLRRWLRDVKDQHGPVLLHVLTEKGPRRAAGERRSGHVSHAAGVREGRPRPHHRVAQERRLEGVHRRRQHDHLRR